MKYDPNFSKCFQMKDIGIPLIATQHALERDGHDPNCIKIKC